MAHYKTTSYLRTQYNYCSLEDFDIASHLYGKMRTSIMLDRERLNEEYNCTWRYFYGGYCDLDTEICYLELTYGPDVDKKWIIKKAET